MSSRNGRRIKILGFTGILGYYYFSKIYDFYKWKTHSMEPFINLGDYIFVDRLSQDYESKFCTYM